MNYLLRRNDCGYDACRFIETATQGRLKSVNKDKETLPSAEYVFRWGTTSSIPSGTVINKAEAIHKVYDKRGFRKLLADNGLAPRTWVDFESFLDTSLGGKMVIRPAHHSRGDNLTVASSFGDIYRAVKNLQTFYISELIEKVAEYRVFVVSGRVIGMIKKVPVDTNAVYWGCAEEGMFEYIPWSQFPMSVVKNAKASFDLSGLDFGAVDLVVDGQGKVFCLEINTAPEIWIYWAECFGKAFEYIVQNGRDHIPVNGDTWKHHIHPAIFEGAVV